MFSYITLVVSGSRWSRCCVAVLYKDWGYIVLFLLVVFIQVSLKTDTLIPNSQLRLSISCVFVHLGTLFLESIKNTELKYFTLIFRYNVRIYTRDVFK